MKKKNPQVSKGSNSMNTNRIKQVFQNLVNGITPDDQAPDDLPLSEEPVMITGPLLIRGGLVLRGDSAKMYMDALEEIGQIATENETWSKSSVDDVLTKHLLPILAASPQLRSQVTREQLALIQSHFKQIPQLWAVDLSVYGIRADWSGFCFGKAQFHVAPASVQDHFQSLYPPPEIVARLEIEAADQEAAVNRATRILEEHLAVLNAICVDSMPSQYQLSHNIPKLREYCYIRATPSNEIEEKLEAKLSSTAKNLVFALERAYAEKTLAKLGGERISKYLSHRTEFGDRLLSGYAMAGAGAVEQKRELSFLLYAIALESVVLGKSTKSELTFQLAARAAHLIGQSLERKRSLVDEVTSLYALRSLIVHTGSTEVAESELKLLAKLCLLCLYSLTNSSAFQSMSTSQELENWFKDQMLDAPDPHSSH